MISCPFLLPTRSPLCVCNFPGCCFPDNKNKCTQKGFSLMQMDANNPNRADDALATALGRFEQLTIVLPQGGLNVYASPFVPQEVKRCTYCLGVWPAFMFSKTQWNVRKLRARWRREHEQTASDELKEIFAAFDADGEPFLWRRCNNCRETNKCLRGVLGLQKKTVFAPDLSFLDDNDGNEGVTSGDERGRDAFITIVVKWCQLRRVRCELSCACSVWSQPSPFRCQHSRLSSAWCQRLRRMQDSAGGCEGGFRPLRCAS